MADEYIEIDRSAEQLIHSIDFADGVLKSDLVNTINLAKDVGIEIIDTAQTFEALPEGFLYVKPNTVLSYVQRTYCEDNEETSYSDESFSTNTEKLIMKSFNYVVFITPSDVYRFRRVASNTYAVENFYNKQNKLSEGAGVKLKRKYDGTTEISVTGGGGGGTTDYTELENKPQINGVTLDGNKTANELGIYTDLSYKYVETLPVSNIDSNTGYLTKDTRPTINYGDYITNKVLYPTGNLPSFTFATDYPTFVFYNSVDEKFYKIKLTKSFSGNSYNISIANGNLNVQFSYMVCTVWTYGSGDSDWVEIYDKSSGGIAAQYSLQLSSAHPIKMVYTSAQFTITDGASTYTVTNIGESSASTIYANFFDATTGEYLGDLDNIDESGIFIFNMNVYRNNAWQVVGKVDLQKVLEQFAKQTALDEKLDTSSVKQTTGSSTTDVMSQKAVTDALTGKQPKNLYFQNVTVSEWVGNTFNIETFDGDGETTVFNLTGTVASGMPTVKVNDTEATDFTYSSGVITFTTAPANGDDIEVTYNKTPDVGFERYPYKSVITAQGVTANSPSHVYYNDAQAASGSYSGLSSGANTLTVYSFLNTSITIPLISVEVVS